MCTCNAFINLSGWRCRGSYIGEFTSVTRRVGGVCMHVGGVYNVRGAWCSNTCRKCEVSCS